MIPFGMVEQLLRLVNNLIESDPPEVRQAKALIIFRTVIWPLLSRSVDSQTRQQVEALLTQASQ